MSFTRTIVERFEVISCYMCGVHFGITADLHRRVVREARGSVYCPACGKQTCWRESEDEKRIQLLKRQLSTANNRAETAKRRAVQAENKLRATKGVVTRMKNRVGRGVCPCCNRHFENLQRHMESKHPGYLDTE